MAAETAAIREKSRRVKNHILDRYLKLADRVDEKGVGDLSENEVSTYWKLTEDFAKNVIPRTQEITGDDGEAINVQVVKYADNPTALPVPAETVPTADIPSV